MPRTHSSLPRLFVPDDLGAGTLVHLGKDQSLYLAAVMRRRAGDAVVVFNGRDGAWRAVLEADAKRAVTLRLESRVAEQTARADLWFGFAPLKAERLDWVVQRATEMGAGVIQPVMTDFTQSRTKPEKLGANILEAAEQCEVLSIPELWAETRLADLLDTWQTLHGPRRLLFADEAAASASPLDALGTIGHERIGLLVGPEGGFSETERARLYAAPFVLPISLGPRILRADTAAVAALAVVQASIGDWR